MYANYSQKVQETINRPRFFYLNLIYPNISSHYAKVIKLYQETLVKKNRITLLYVLLLLLKNNNINNNTKLAFPSSSFPASGLFPTLSVGKREKGENQCEGSILYNGSNYFDNYKGDIYYSDKHTRKVKTASELITPIKSPNIRYSIKAFKNYFKELE